MEPTGYQIRKGLFVRAKGTAGRIYKITKTTKRRAVLQAQDSQRRQYVLDRSKVFILTEAIGHKYSLA